VQGHSLAVGMCAGRAASASRPAPAPTAWIRSPN